jgi:hypothetical protein
MTDMKSEDSNIKLSNIVTTKIPAEDFETLQWHTRILYIDNHIEQPTISHLVRWIIKIWASQAREKEARKKKLTALDDISR